MVKLIRIASQNDCNFEANFDNDMTIKPNSSIAVLNATFKSPFQQIAITSENNKISFQGTLRDSFGTPLTSNTCLLKINNYSGQNALTAFCKNLVNTLNGTLNCQFSTDAGEGSPIYNNRVSNSFFSEFWLGPVDLDSSGDISIPENLVFQYAYAPLLTPFGPTATGGPHGANGTLNSRIWNVSTSITATLGDNTAELSAGTARTELPIHKCYPGFENYMAMGTSLYMARVADFTDNGTGLINNGFAIGLSLEQFLMDEEDEMPDINRLYEIEFRKQGQPYFYRNNELVEQDSGSVEAEQCSLTTYPTLNTHDVLWFRIRGDQNPASSTYQKHILEAGVWQIVAATNTPRETVFFKREITDEENYTGLKPYMFIKGQQGDVKVDAICYPLTPFGNKYADSRPSQIDWNSPFADGTGDENLYPNDYRILTTEHPNDLRSGDLGQFAPRVLFNRWNSQGLTFTTTLQMNDEIWNYIGFQDQVKSVSSGLSHLRQKIGNEALAYVNQLVFLGEDSFNLDADDNFMVIIDDLKVDSYDASKDNYDLGNHDSLVARSGRRKNILMTIPVSEDESRGNLVQYATNTPIFIDFLNTQKLNIRNLKLRILRKDFGPVETGFNTSILTLLIKDGGE